METFDLIVIGGGPGGYIAAERAGAAGKRVLLIEKAHLGGTCLNAGCIPTKTLLHAAKLYAQIQNAAKYGVSLENLRFDLAAVIARKQRVVATLRDGVAYQMSRRGVTVREGHAEWVNRTTVRVNDTEYTSTNFIIAAGSSPVIPAIPGIEHALTTTQLLDRDGLPAHLVTLGSGALALGFVTIYRLAGAKVSLITPESRILPDVDAEIVNLLLQEMPDVNVYMEAQVEAITSQGVMLNGQRLEADTVLICGDRAPSLDGLESIGLDLHGGRVNVDSQMRTNLPGIYAVGDVTGIAMWAHAASRMAEVAVNHMLGIHDRFRAHVIPIPVYTYPEIASVGLTAEAAEARGMRVKVGRLPLNANGRFVIENEGRRGLCKVVVDEDTERLVGVHLFAPNAADLIFGAAAMLEDEFRACDLKQVLFAHPTVSEIIRDTVYEVK